MAELHVSPEAHDDLRDIKEYITEELGNPSAAANTVSKITRAMRGLVAFPDIGAPLSPVVKIPNNYRFLVCGNYLVLYRHEGNTVYVMRVVYGKRDYIKILFGETPDNEPE